MGLFKTPKIPQVQTPKEPPPPPSPAFEADPAQRGAIANDSVGTLRSLVNTTSTGLATKAKTGKRSLIGGA